MTSSDQDAEAIARLRLLLTSLDCSPHWKWEREQGINNDLRTALDLIARLRGERDEARAVAGFPGALADAVPLVTDELEGLAHKWPRVVHQIMASERRAEAAEAQRDALQAERDEAISEREAQFWSDDEDLLGEAILRKQAEDRAERAETQVSALQARVGVLTGALRDAHATLLEHMLHEAPEVIEAARQALTEQPTEQQDQGASE